MTLKLRSFSSSSVRRLSHTVQYISVAEVFVLRGAEKLSVQGCSTGKALEDSAVDNSVSDL